MADKPLKRMSRRELVDIIYALQEREAALNERIAELEGAISKNKAQEQVEAAMAAAQAGTLTRDTQREKVDIKTQIQNNLLQRLV